MIADILNSGPLVLVLSSKIIPCNDVADSPSPFSSLSFPRKTSSNCQWSICHPRYSALSMTHLVHAPTEKQSSELKCYILDRVRPMQGIVSQGWPSKFLEILGTCSRIRLASGSFLSLLSHIELVSRSSSQISPTWPAVNSDGPVLTCY